ncbi:MAG TPA: methionyl-tRNA formyltransferase [Anaeromyxobacteraceae bacterium]|nr:methionyl-tRNA formyltransferase [Anaeromyxobacteraceae bacterium]
MKIAYLGTPAFAVLPLDALHAAGHEIACVVAQPDRPAGRGQEVKEPATKAWAREHGVAVLQPEKVRDGRLAADLRALGPDVLVVAAYGRILGEDLLGLAPLGALNVHGSLLPRWRGAAPVQWALAEGDAETGVTIMQMDAGLDTGDILLQRAVEIRDGDTADALLQRVGEAGAAAAVEALPLLAAGRLTPVRQDPAQATHARILEKDDGRLDFALPAGRLAHRVRGFSPWPGAFTLLGGKLLKVHAARAVAADEPLARAAGALAPGEARAARDGILVGCGGGSALLLAVVQLEGRRRQPASEFLQGHELPPGLRLGA